MSSSNFARLSTLLGMQFGAVRKGVTPKKILEYVLSEMVMTQTDNGLAHDADTMCRYLGMTEAYKNVAHFIAPFKNVEILAPAVTNGAKAAVTNGTKDAVTNGAKAAVKAAANGKA